MTAFCIANIEDKKSSATHQNQWNVFIELVDFNNNIRIND